MNISTETLKAIYERANQFAITKRGEEPDRLTLQDDGTICAVWTTYACGDWDEESEDIKAEDLSANLDLVAEERRKREEEARIAQEEMNRQNEIARTERAKEERRQQYLKLKREFN